MHGLQHWREIQITYNHGSRGRDSHLYAGMGFDGCNEGTKRVLVNHLSPGSHGYGCSRLHVWGYLTQNTQTKSFVPSTITTKSTGSDSDSTCQCEC